MAEYVSYEDQPESGGGKFLNLKTKGDKATIRLASKPITYFVHWVDGKVSQCENKETCAICKELAGLSVDEAKKEENSKKRRRQTYIWAVIDRADGQAKVYKAGVSIFLSVREFAVDPKWGGPEKDATRFDLTITRTETSLQNFYSVIPDPTSLNVPITAEEQKEVAKLAPLIDSVAIFAGESKEVASTDNPKNPEGFIEGLEADQKAEGIAEAFK